MSIESRLSALEADKSASLSPNQVPIKQDISDSDFVYIHNTSTGKVERVSKSVFNADINSNGVESYYISPEPTPQTENFFIDVIVADNINNRAEQIPQSSKLIYIYTLFQYGGQSFRKIWVLDNSNRAYGQGTPPIGAGNLIEFNTQALQQNSVVDLGDIGALVGNETYEEHLRDYINAQDPSIGLINSGTIRADFGGDVREFNFSNVTGDYGLNVNQTDVTDFQLYGESNNVEDASLSFSYYNLIIGGVGNTITSKELLAEMFTFTESEVLLFKIFNNDVYAYINNANYSAQPVLSGGHTVPYIFKDNNDVTYIEEKEARLTTLSLDFGRGCENLKYAKIKGVTQIGESCFFGATNLIPERCDFSGVTALGGGANTFMDIQTTGDVDFPNLISITGLSNFRNTPWSINAPKLESVGSSALFAYPLKRLFSPNLITLAGNNITPSVDSEITVDYSLKFSNGGDINAILQNILNAGGKVIYANVPNIATETANTLTSIDLTNPNGNFCNMGTANTNETFNISNSIAGGNALVLINTVNDITVNGSTRITADDHIPNTDMYLYVRSNGVRIEYWLEII